MSGLDLNVDYEKQARDADAAIARIAEMAQSGRTGAAHDDDLPMDDNISINSKELNALENSEMDEAEMERILNGDDHDDELNDLLTDDSDGELDIDDPKALEKLEAKVNRSENKGSKQDAKPAPAPAKKPQQQQQSQAPAATVDAKPTQPTAAPPKVAPEIKSAPSKTTPAAAAAGTAAPPKVISKAAKQKANAPEYAKLIKSVNENIEQVKSHVTMYLKQKDQASASKYLPIVKQSQACLATIQQAEKDGDDVPAYEYGSLSIQKEKKNTDIGQDDLWITAVNMVNIKSTAKYSLKFNLHVGKEQSQTTKQVKGKDVVEFNQNLIFKLSPTNIRSSQNGLKLCKLARCTVELHSHGMLWGSTVVGTGDLKMSPLQTKCESVQTIKIKDEESVIVGELEVKISLNCPFTTPEYEETTINIIKLSTAPQDVPEIKPVATAQVTKAAAAGTPKPAAAAAPAQPTEKDPDDMTSVEIIKASGFSKSLQIFDSLAELPPFLGLDALNAEKETCMEMMQTKTFKRRMELFHCQQRASDCKMKVMTLEAQVGSGALEPQMYCDLLKGQVTHESILIDETTKVAKWYNSKGKADDARYYAELVKWFKDRKALAEKEHEQMVRILEGGDEEEEEEEEAE